MEANEKINYYDKAMNEMNGDSMCLSAYRYLKGNEQWVQRYEDFLKGTKTHNFLEL